MMKNYFSKHYAAINNIDINDPNSLEKWYDQQSLYYDRGIILSFLICSIRSYMIIQFVMHGHIPEWVLKKYLLNTFFRKTSFMSKVDIAAMQASNTSHIRSSDNILI